MENKTLIVPPGNTSHLHSGTNQNYDKRHSEQPAPLRNSKWVGNEMELAELQLGHKHTHTNTHICMEDVTV